VGLASVFELGLFSCKKYGFVHSEDSTFTFTAKLRKKNKQMTKTLNWKLKTLPDATDIASLVEQKVITADEAREILFNSRESEKDQENEALKEQIRFMEKTVEDLIKQMGTQFKFGGYQYHPRTPLKHWYSAQGTMLVNSTTNTVSYAPGHPTL
jgi:hypothetical protein